MADVTTLTPEARQAILLHLQGGGDPAHAAAIASGAITPQLAQQLAAQAPDSSASLLNPEQMRALAAAGQPADGSIPVSPADLAAAQAAMAAPAQNPVVQVDSQLPMIAQPKNDQQLAENVVSGVANQGEDLKQKSEALNLAAIAQQSKAKDSAVGAAEAKKALDDKVNVASRDILAKSNEEVAAIDQREYDQLQQRQATMDKILGNMLTSANEAAQVAPHDFWYNRSTSSKIFAVISQIAGGAANGLANQPGQPTALDRIISSDLDQQRLAFAQKSQTNNQNSGIYNDLVKANESQTAAYGALRIAAYKRVIAQLQQAAVDDPALKSNADYQQALANANQKLADSYQATSKTLGEQSVDASKAALTSATSLGTTEMKDKTELTQARITADGKIKAAEVAAGGAEGKDWTLAGIHVIKDKEALPVDKAARPIIEKTMAAADVIQNEVHHVEAVLAAGKSMDTATKAALLAQAKATIVREIGAGYNAGNRPADIYGAMVAGGVPKNMAQSLLSYFTADDLSPEATLAAMKATAASVRYNVNAQLKPFNRELD